jgi:(2Fe-2S) ferredoxin
MGTIANLKRELPQLPSKNRDLFTRKIIALRDRFSAPKVLPLTASFCDPHSKRACLTVCESGKCECGCEPVRQATLEEVERMGLGLTVGKMKTGCEGNCRYGPIMGFPQKQFFYLGVKPSDVPRILAETIIRGKLIFPLLSISPERAYRNDVFYDKQTGMLAGIDERVCMVDVARYFLEFEDNMSCGKCAPCRIGMKRAYEGVTRIAQGEGTEEDLEHLRILYELMEQTPNCGFAGVSIKPLRSAVLYFENEFREHFEKKLCTAGVCKELVEFQRKKAVRKRLGLGLE